MKKVLLVEDNEINREMMVRRLQRRQFEVLAAVNGQDAIEKALSFKPDIILMDMSLPVLDGWEATRRLRADPATSSIPIIGLTAHAMSSDRQQALDAGCNDYATKPVEFEKLIEMMNKYLDAQLH
jgi:two-component system, cell cycle response regulator DivK